MDCFFPGCRKIVRDTIFVRATHHIRLPIKNGLYFNVLPVAPFSPVLIFSRVPLTNKMKNMIDPKDVRPGNWVIKMTGMDVNHLPYFSFQAVALDEYFYSFIKVCFPIPLTTSIFGKCGFKHDFGDWYMNHPADDVDGGLPFLRYRLKEKSWYLRNVKLPAQPIYLHQLQNLYQALTHKELNVQLGTFENPESVGPIDFFNKRPQATVVN